MNPQQASEAQKQSILKYIDDQIRLVWSALVENQYTETINAVPQMVNASQDKIGATLSCMKIKKIMAVDSL